MLRKLVAIGVAVFCLGLFTLAALNGFDAPFFQPVKSTTSQFADLTLAIETLNENGMTPEALGMSPLLSYSGIPDGFLRWFKTKSRNLRIHGLKTYIFKHSLLI